MILEIKNCKKYFGGIHAIDNCSLSIERGKITSIIGPNGSGKTTLFNVISRLLDIDSGKLLFRGEDISQFQDYQLGKKYISRTFQEVRLFRNLTIRDHIEIAFSSTDELLFKNFFAKRKSSTKKIRDLLSLVGLQKPLNTYVTDLSYGQRKLLDLAIAIAKPHSILMLDEPVAGVNPQLRQEIKKILRKLKKSGETIILIEHDMNFVMDLADYIWVMDAGKIIACGKPRDIQNNKKVLDAYLGA